MALYRNIAGVHAIGAGALSIFNQATTWGSAITPSGPVEVVEYLPPGTTWGTPTQPVQVVDTLPPDIDYALPAAADSPPKVVEYLDPGVGYGTGIDPQDVQQLHQEVVNSLADEMLSRYNYLLQTPLSTLTQNGYYVDVDTASVMLLQDGGSAEFLALQWVQDIENAAGTAGTLFMHLSQPVLAKDTAGYAGGGRASTGATVLYSTPIPEVLALPVPPTGPNVINDYNPPVPTNPTVTPLGGSSTTPTTQQSISSKNTLGLLTIAGITLVIIAGPKVLKKRSGIALAGGLGLLYYSMKQKTV